MFAVKNIAVYLHHTTPHRMCCCNPDVLLKESHLKDGFNVKL